jgi:hypothetical protein
MRELGVQLGNSGLLLASWRGVRLTRRGWRSRLSGEGVARNGNFRFDHPNSRKLIPDYSALLATAFPGSQARSFRWSPSKDPIGRRN